MRIEISPTDKAVVITHRKLMNIGCNQLLNFHNFFLVFLAPEEAIDA
jgi:hypothetical protein